MKKAFFSQLRTNLQSMPKQVEPTVLFPSAIEAAKELILKKMQLFGSVGKKNLYSKEV
ncbi:hypothetical protein D3C77_771040 [compost metagenome]